MTAALADTRRTVKPLLRNWGLWCNRHNILALGYTIQGWQRFVQCGRRTPPPPEIDVDEADMVQREYQQVANYNPMEAFVGKVYYSDNWDGRMTREDMARDTARRWGSGCSVATFYRRLADFERLMAQHLGY